MVDQRSNSLEQPHRIALISLIIAFIIAYYPVIRGLAQVWINSEDNSHGLLIIPICLFIIWKHRFRLKEAEIHPGQLGWLLILLSIAIYIFASLSMISTLSSLSMVITLWAIVWSLFGKAVFRIILFPMLFLLLMIPVPAQFYAMATVPLQLLVSKASTFIISSLGVPILREGNVLHLPGQTLAVVQACSGIRSLMSLVTLSAIFGYLTLSSNYLRTILIGCSIPAAILVNIIRVVIMIAAFQYFNLDLSKGTLHILFGVVIFILTLLIVAMAKGLLSKWDIKQTPE